MEQPTDLSAIPSGMDNDPNADEEIINQQRGETVPLAKPDAVQEADADELANQIAYALDGSGVGLPGSTPVVGDEQAVTTRGTTDTGSSEDI